MGRGGGGGEGGEEIYWTVVDTRATLCIFHVLRFRFGIEHFFPLRPGQRARARLQPFSPYPPLHSYRFVVINLSTSTPEEHWSRCLLVSLILMMIRFVTIPFPCLLARSSTSAPSPADLQWIYSVCWVGSSENFGC